MPSSRATMTAAASRRATTSTTAASYVRALARGHMKATMAHDLPVYADGKLRAFTDLGGYPLFYRTKREHDLCVKCAQEAVEEGEDCFDPPVTAEVNTKENAMLFMAVGVPDGTHPRVTSSPAEIDNV